MAAPFWRLEHLSDQQLVAGLQSVLRAKRRALAELVAHLGEVEERRLHLQAAYGSLFSYCVQRLGMSEDEACRRIELARLARRFPALFSELASGGLTLSVALLLKPVLVPDNHLELIAAVRGASSRRAAEILAERFPRPDAPSRIRKLPERWAPAASSSPPLSTPPPSPRAEHRQITGSEQIPSPSSALPSSPPLSSPPPPSAPPPSTALAPCTPPRLDAPQAGSRQRIEPLSAGRYRVQFTADTSLKRKLEQARDLLRHAEPQGDFAAIVSRALDTLLKELLRRRFGAPHQQRAARRPAPTAAPALAPTLPPPAVAPSNPSVTAHHQGSHPAPRTPTAPPALPPTLPPSAAAPRSPGVTAHHQGSHSAPHSARIRAPSRATRRAVLERDGLRCSWVDGAGRRCDSAAWLELDHRHPAGRGGSSDPENLRLLCRAHNRLAAERAYGRAHIERAIRERPQPAQSAPARTPR